MKLSEILGRILTDVALRRKYPREGVCFLVQELGGGHMYMPFLDARDACKQTTTYAYPVLGMAGVGGPEKAFDEAERSSTMWRGEYGRNRRKLVRDCWRWAKERGL